MMSHFIWRKFKFVWSCTEFEMRMIEKLLAIVTGKILILMSHVASVWEQRFSIVSV